MLGEAGAELGILGLALRIGPQLLHDQTGQGARLGRQLAGRVGVGPVGEEDHPGQPFHRPENVRSEEHTSELQSLMRISYAVFCLKKKHNHDTTPISSSYSSSTDARTHTTNA